ncbi:MAG: tripartite tricarboxylate transporter substrate-binding protein [Betaproteobacteria bacterium]
MLPLEPAAQQRLDDRRQARAVVRGTPPAIIKRVHDALIKIMQQPEIINKFAAIGMDTTTSATPADFAQMLQDEIKRWPPVVKAAGIQPE